VTNAPPPSAPVPPRTAPRGRTTPWVAIVIAILVALGVLRACAGHENSYEHVTRELNAAIQENDLNAVKKLEDTATADTMSRARLGAATDALEPLGKLRRVKEVALPSDAAATPRLHQFDVSFEHGTVREEVTFNSKDQVVHFHYDAPVRK